MQGPAFIQATEESTVTGEVQHIAQNAMVMDDITENVEQIDAQTNRQAGCQQLYPGHGDGWGRHWKKKTLYTD